VTVKRFDWLQHPYWTGVGALAAVVALALALFAWRLPVSPGPPDTQPTASNRTPAPTTIATPTAAAAAGVSTYLQDVPVVEGETPGQGYARAASEQFQHSVWLTVLCANGDKHHATFQLGRRF
jgi:hypothetical protein